MTNDTSRSGHVHKRVIFVLFRLLVLLRVASVAVVHCLARSPPLTHRCVCAQRRGSGTERSSPADTTIFVLADCVLIPFSKANSYETMTDTLIDDEIIDVRQSTSRPGASTTSSQITTTTRRPMYIETEVRTDTVTTRRMASAAANRSVHDTLENTKSPTQ